MAKPFDRDRGRQLCRSRSRSGSHIAVLLLLLVCRLACCVVGARLLRQTSRKDARYSPLQPMTAAAGDDTTPIYERSSSATTVTLVDFTGDKSLGDQKIPVQRRTQIVDVQIFNVKLVILLNYLDEATSDTLAGGDPSDPIVHRFCSAVNRQSGGSQARKSAEEDGLTLFTRSDYLYPATGCEIIDTNVVYTEGGAPDFGPGYVGLEISLSQEVLITSQTEGDATTTTGDVSYEQAYRHVSQGFIGGTGGKAKFRNVLKNKDGDTGQTIAQFDSIVDVAVVDGLGDPVPRPTAAPTAAFVPTLPPSARPTLRPTRRPTQAPTNEPTGMPSIKPVATEPDVGSPSTFQPKTELPTEGPMKAPGGKGGGNANSVKQPESTSDGEGSVIPTAAIAAAAGAGFGILVVGLLSLYRCHTEDDEWKREQDPPVAAAVPAEVVRTRTRGWSTVQSPPPPPSPKPPASQSQLLGARPPPILAVVTDADGRSLAESTLGDRTAGRKAWAPPPPPVYFLKATWTSGDGIRAKAAPSSGFSIAAASQISSLDSGTVGAGGQTVGGFSLEAAIREDDTDDDERGAIKAGVSSANSDDGVAEDGKGKPDTLAADSEEEASLAGTASIAGTAFISETGEAIQSNAVAPLAIPSDVGAYGTPSAPITPNDSLVGTSSLFGASSMNSVIESNSRRTSGPSVSTMEVPDGIKARGGDAATPLPPPDQTPRASGNGGDHYGGRTNGYACVTPPPDAEDNVKILLPTSLTPQGKELVVVGDSSLVDDRPGAISPDPSSASEKSWAGVFAEGTGAILSASLEAQRSDGSEVSSVDDILPPPPPPTPPTLLVSKRSSPDSLRGKDLFPTDFPETPLADPPFSDGSGGPRFDGKDVSRLLDNAAIANDKGKDSVTKHAPWLLQRESKKTVAADQSEQSTSPCSSSSSSLKRLHQEDQRSSDGLSLHLSSTTKAIPPPPPPSPDYPPPSPDLSTSLKSSSSAVQSPQSIAAGSVSKSSPLSYHSQPRNKAEIDLRAIAHVAVAASTDGGSPSAATSTAPPRIAHRASPRSPRGQALEGVSSKTLGLRTPLPTTPPTPAAAFSGPIGDNESAGSNSSSSSGPNPHPWLLDALAGTLGPRGQSADMESLSEPSVRSSSSQTSTRSYRSNVSTPVGRRSAKYRQNGVGAIPSSGSVGSRSSRTSHHSQYSAASRSVASDLQRLENQLSMLGPAEKDELYSTVGAASNAGSAQSVASSKHTPSASSFVTGRSQMSVTAPPGRLGVILANRSEGRGTVVSALRTSSVLVGKVLPGDRLVAIDGQDVSGLQVGEVTAIMAKRAHKDRILTIITPSKIQAAGAVPTAPGSEKGSIPGSSSAMESSAVNA